MVEKPKLRRCLAHSFSVVGEATDWQWLCESKVGFAFGYSPEAAYLKWTYAIRDARRSNVLAKKRKRAQAREARAAWESLNRGNKSCGSSREQDKSEVDGGYVGIPECPASKDMGIPSQRRTGIGAAILGFLRG